MIANVSETAPASSFTSGTIVALKTEMLLSQRFLVE